MSKLVYPVTGIYNMVRDSASSCLSNLNNASGNCNFDIPSNFSQGSYLRGLSSKISDCARDIRTIDTKLDAVNRSYQRLEDDLTMQNGKFVGIKIKERDRMIY